MTTFPPKYFPPSYFGKGYFTGTGEAANGEISANLTGSGAVVGQLSNTSDVVEDIWFGGFGTVIETVEPKKIDRSLDLHIRKAERILDGSERVKPSVVEELSVKIADQPSGSLVEDTQAMDFDAAVLGIVSAINRNDLDVMRVADFAAAFAAKQQALDEMAIREAMANANNDDAVVMLMLLAA